MDLSLNRNGLYNFIETGGDLPDFAARAIKEEGSSYVHAYQSIVYAYFSDKERLGLPNTQVSRDALASVVAGYWIPRDVNWKPEVDLVMR